MTKPTQHPRAAQSPYTKTVTVDGMTFKIMSRYERAVTDNGRHFVAFGSRGRGYMLVEYDRDITIAGIARSIGRSPQRIPGGELVDRIKHLVMRGELLPPDLGPPAAS